MQDVSFESLSWRLAHKTQLDLARVDAAYKANDGVQARAGVALAALNMLGSSWECAKQGVQEFWKDRIITQEILDSLKQAAKYFLLVIVGIVVGMILPTAFVSIGRGLTIQILHQAQKAISAWKKTLGRILFTTVGTAVVAGLGFVAYQLTTIQDMAEAEKAFQQLGAKVKKWFEVTRTTLGRWQISLQEQLKVLQEEAFKVCDLVTAKVGLLKNAFMKNWTELPLDGVATK